MKKLIVHNFGPVKSAEIEIRKFNLFIGEQSVGKSTLAKLITIFTDHIHLLMFLQSKETAWSRFLIEYDLNSYVNEEYRIMFVDEEDNYCVNVEVVNGIVDAKYTEGGEQITDFKDILAGLLTTKPIYHPDIFEGLREKQINELLSILANSIYLPAERSVAAFITKLLPLINVVDETLPKTLSKFLYEYNNAREKYNNHELAMLNVTYRKVEDTDTILLKNGKSLPLKNASSGMQSALPLLLTTYYCVNNKEYESFVVEEPECNLFPQKQHELISFLLSNVIGSGRMLTITTHSPYILSTLNNYLYAGKVSDTLDSSESDDLRKIVDSKLWLHSNDCSIYSLGNEANGVQYCQSLISKATGLIDFNALDGISISTSEDFSRIQRLHVVNQRKNKKT